MTHSFPTRRSSDLDGVSCRSICSCIADSPTLPPVPIKNFVERLMASSVMAKPQVAFSRKSPVRCTPITWLDPPNVEESPPPLGFCTSITTINKRQARIARTNKNAYMIYRSSLFQFLNKASRSEEHTPETQSLMHISYTVF